MQSTVTIIGLLASLAGVVSVYYWWTSARMGPIDIPSATMPKGEPGDELLDYGGPNMIFLNHSRQSRLNAYAAAWTGASVLLQAIAIILPMIATKPGQ